MEKGQWGSFFLLISSVPSGGTSVSDTFDLSLPTYSLLSENGEVPYLIAALERKNKKMLSKATPELFLTTKSRWILNYSLPYSRRLVPLEGMGLLLG